MPSFSTLSLAIAALVVTGAACGSDDSTDTGASTTKTTVSASPAGGDGESFEPADTIVIKNFEFSPERAAVKVGDKIKVRNEDTAIHSITAKDDKSLFDTGQFTGGEREITLTKAGTFDFECSVHPYMLGVIQVSA